MRPLPHHVLARLMTYVCMHCELTGDKHDKNLKCLFDATRFTPYRCFICNKFLRLFTRAGTRVEGLFDSRQRIFKNPHEPTRWLLCRRCTKNIDIRYTQDLYAIALERKQAHEQKKR